MSINDEQILGVIFYAAQSGDYILSSYIFTDKRVLQVPLSRMRELAINDSGLQSKAMIFASIAGLTMFQGMSGAVGLVGLKQWKDLRNKTSDKPVVKIEKSPLSLELASAATSSLSYEKIKDVKIKKVMLSSDYLLHLGAGFLHTEMVVFDGRAVEEVKNLIKNTPLASKLKE